MTLWQTLFSFNGRIARAPYWLAGLAIVLVDLSVILFAQGWLQSDLFSGDQPHPVDGPLIAAGLTVTVTTALSLWTGLALNMKRLHDRNRSGWWLLVVLIPALGAIWLIVELGFLPGDKRRNRFGPSPDAFDRDIEAVEETAPRPVEPTATPWPTDPSWVGETYSDVNPAAGHEPFEAANDPVRAPEPPPAAPTAPAHP